MSTAESAVVELEPSIALPARLPKPSAIGRTPPWRRRLASLSRWLHTCLSRISVAILFLFTVTGLTVNHPEWFSARQQTRQLESSINPVWVNGGDENSAARLEIVELLRPTHGIKTALSGFRVDDWQRSVSFTGPGYVADAFIDRNTGRYDLTGCQMGFVAIINDLHKGRDPGSAGMWLIDISAVLMTLVSLSGLALVFFVPRVRTSGIAVALAGAVSGVVVCLLWVP